MTKQILHAQTKDNVQYQLYLTSIIHPAYCKDPKGREMSKQVKFSRYGIVAIIFIGLEQIYYDSGPIVSCYHIVNALYNRLYQTGVTDVDNIRQIIWSEHSKWYDSTSDNVRSMLTNEMLKKDMNKQQDFYLLLAWLATMGVLFLFDSNYKARNEKYAKRRKQEMEEKRKINDEQSMLLRQLVMQNQLLMAGLVLQTYFIR